MIAAGTAVFYESSLLLAKRVQEYKGEPVPFGGYWSIFTGAVDPEDESIAHAAQRELKEETDLEVRLEDLISIGKVENPGCTLNIYAYESPELVFPLLDDEHTEWGWFSIDNLKNFNEKIDSKILECIYSYKNL